MRHKTLREMAKIGVGLVVADIATTLWYAGSGLLPMTILGVRWTDAMVPEILAFDIAILLLLVHFGWNMELPIKSPSERTLLMIAGILFLVISVAHLTRLAFGVHIILGDFFVPAWLSWAGFFITGYLAYSCFHFTTRIRNR